MKNKFEILLMKKCKNGFQTSFRKIHSPYICWSELRTTMVIGQQKGHSVNLISSKFPWRSINALPCWFDIIKFKKLRHKNKI